jgi:hypothetical protein
MAKVKEEVFDPPRWPGGPPICVAENLPAFKDLKEIADFIERNCPAIRTWSKWQCRACNMWHHDGSHPGASGASSGTTRIADVQRYHLKYYERRADEPIVGDKRMLELANDIKGFRVPRRRAQPAPALPPAKAKTKRSRKTAGKELL